MRGRKGWCVPQQGEPGRRFTPLRDLRTVTGHPSSELQVDLGTGVSRARSDRKLLVLGRIRPGLPPVEVTSWLNNFQRPTSTAEETR